MPFILTPDSLMLTTMKAVTASLHTVHMHCLGLSVHDLTTGLGGD